MGGKEGSRSPLPGTGGSYSCRCVGGGGVVPDVGGHHNRRAFFPSKGRAPPPISCFHLFSPHSSSSAPRSADSQTRESSPKSPDTPSLSPSYPQHTQCCPSTRWPPSWRPCRPSAPPTRASTTATPSQ